MMEMSISSVGEKVTLDQSGMDGSVLLVGIEGWYGTPSLKVNPVERQMGDGGHEVFDEAVLYSSRVVTVQVLALGGTDGRMLELTNSLLRMTHRNVSVELDDAGTVTEVCGFMSIEWGRKGLGGRIPGTLTIVCADPRRYGARSKGFMNPAASPDGGLLFHETDGYLLLPLSFYGDVESGTTCTVSNQGTALAYPVITARGNFPRGVTISHPGGELVFSGPISTSAPLVLDSLTRTATVNGVDVTRSLARRDFPVVPAGGSIVMSTVSSGTGTVVAECRDTYI